MKLKCCFALTIRHVVSIPIHVVVVFVDVVGELGVMVELRNNPFVFCNPVRTVNSFSLDESPGKG